MSLFRLDASIRVEGSHSRAIADIVEQEWRNARPCEPVSTVTLGSTLSERRAATRTTPMTSTER